MLNPGLHEVLPVTADCSAWVTYALGCIAEQEKTTIANLLGDLATEYVTTLGYDPAYVEGHSQYEALCELAADEARCEKRTLELD